jgi:hypothetical protein
MRKLEPRTSRVWRLYGWIYALALAVVSLLSRPVAASSPLQIVLFTAAALGGLGVIVACHWHAVRAVPRFIQVDEAGITVARRHDIPLTFRWDEVHRGNDPVREPIWKRLLGPLLGLIGMGAWKILWEERRARPSVSSKSVTLYRGTEQLRVARSGLSREDWEVLCAFVSRKLRERGVLR